MLQLIRRSAVVAAALAASLAFAACGSSDKGSTGTGASAPAGTAAASAGAADDALATADKTVEEFSSPVQWPGPNDKVTPPAGKKLTVIICGSQGITCVRVGNGVKAAGEALGYDVKVVDGRSDPTVWNQAIKSAVADKTDGIALAAIPPAVVAGAIKSAEAAGIPVAAGLSTAGEAQVKVNPNRTDSARAQAAFVAKDSGGQAKVLVVRDDEFPETKQASDEFAVQLKQMCPGCEIVDSTDFTLALAAQRLSGKVTQSLRNHPDIDYIVPPFDTVNVFIQQGIAQAQKKGKVKIVGVGGDPPSVDAIKAGDEVASVGQAGEWIGWDLVDGLTRIFAGQDVPALDQETDSNYVAPQRYITADTELDPRGWQGGFDYATKYKELWGK